MKVPDQILDRIKGNLFKYAPEVYLHRTFYKTIFYLSRDRIFNYFNYRWALEKTKKVSHEPPETLIVETTNLCNAKCTMCIIPVMGRTRGSMSQELFGKIIEDASRSGIRLISLQHIGEPLIDEKLFDRIRLIKKYGLKVMFHTNGSLLDVEKAKLILETGVDIVGISLDAFSKETYQSVRKGLSFEEVKRNVINLMDIKKRKKASLPFVQQLF